MILLLSRYNFSSIGSFISSEGTACKFPNECVSKNSGHQRCCVNHIVDGKLPTANSTDVIDIKGHIEGSEEFV